MNFNLSELHQEVRRSARDVALHQVAPYCRQWDEEERFPSELIPTLAELGFWGIRVPEAYGGAGLDTLAYALVVEEFARVDGSLALTLASHNGLGTSHIMTFGNEAQKAHYLPRLARGEILGAWALTEPSAGSDAASIKTRAQREGEDWVLNGNKTFITQGSVGGVCVVLAVTDPDKSAHGITAFAVDHDTPGFSTSRHLKKLGCRSSDTVELNLEQVRISDSQRIGDIDHGFIDALSILDRGRVSIAAMALGLGEGALAEALNYAKDRVQFGQPIAQFQSTQWKLADSRAELDAARMLTWRAAAMADAGETYSKQASMAKLYASEAASRVCNKALQILGGYGFTREFPVEKHLRDAKLCEIGEGTSEIQRHVIARHILSKGKA